MKVLSLFDGMGCLGIALKDMGIDFDYYTSEVDKHAMKVSKLNFPDSVQLGDVTKWREWDVEWSEIDLIGAGSPCQGFSFAGKQLAFDDPRSALFFTFVEILEHCRKHNPNVLFLLENVRMKKEHELVISRYMGVAPIEINAALVSAQSRQRLFWTNIYNEPYGLFGDMMCMIPQPKDRGILLKDILEDEVDEKYFLSEKALLRAFKKEYSTPKINPNKAGTLNTKNNSAQCSFDSGSSFIKVDIDLNPKSNQNKASSLTVGGNSGGNHSDMDLLIVAQRGRNAENDIITHNLQPRNGKGIGGKGHLQKYDQKSYCLDTGNAQAVEIVYGCDFRTDKGIKIRENGKSGTLKARARNDESCGQLLINQHRIRRLTPTECAKLQTIPDWYNWGKTSDTQIYKMLGNGWCVEVIKHILSYMSYPLIAK